MSTVRKAPPFRLELIIPMVPAALNVSLRAHYGKRAKENLEWDSYLWAETRGRLPNAPLSRARITLTRFSYRTLDFDGLVGSMKPVVDALVYAKVLKDDTWAVTGPWNVSQEFRPKGAGPLLRILIEEIPT